MSADGYKEVRTMIRPNAIIRVYVPDISEEERARRMKEIHDAAALVLKDYYKNHPEEYAKLK